ncbi:MAG: hypothetical protein P4M11_10740 [Candidatus Pacebacteria bacterium]|nr:hypothetical protein [Candidatus Paceibacterota bacterium]
MIRRSCQSRAITHSDHRLDSTHAVIAHSLYRLSLFGSSSATLRYWLSEEGVKDLLRPSSKQEEEGRRRKHAKDAVKSLDDNDDYCALCGRYGQVLLCSKCPHSYHESVARAHALIARPRLIALTPALRSLTMSSFSASSVFCFAAR